MESVMIKLRVKKGLKEQMSVRAADKGQTLSKYLRQLAEDDIIFSKTTPKLKGFDTLTRKPIFVIEEMI